MPVSARIPSATYRLQLNRDFTLRDAAGIVDYLDRLGVTDCYTSPVSQARSGSLHGYDVIDHGGSIPRSAVRMDFASSPPSCRQYAMGIVLDTVPNHMCIADSANQWWYDVLENGPSSPYASFFDIDWNPPKNDLANKILLPVLGDQYGRVLENAEIPIAYRNGAFESRYYDRVFPVAPRSWTSCSNLSWRAWRRAGRSDPEVLELESIVTALDHLPQRTETDAAKVRERQREKEMVKERLAALMETNTAVRSAVEASMAELNGIKGRPRSFDRLETLLADQAYRLSFWHVAADEINYRRFFDVNELAAIRIEDREVFDATHEMILRPGRTRRSQWIAHRPRRRPAAIRANTCAACSAMC